jgi:hypothetical protein
MAIPRNLANIAPHVNASSTELVVNDAGANLDFRVEGDTNANLIFADASADAVGIGTSSPSCRADIVGPSGATRGIVARVASDNGAYIQLVDSGSHEWYVGTLNGTSALVFGDSRNVTADGTERARITSGGYLKVSNNGTYIDAGGTFHEFVQSANDFNLRARATSANYNNNILNLDSTRSASENEFNFILCRTEDGSVNKFIVRASGNCINVNNSYGSISDLKLKQDIVDAGSQWDDIKNIRVRKFRFKNDPTGHLQIGVVAQELQEVSPGLVEESLDYEEVEVPVLDDEGNAVLNEDGTPKVTQERNALGTTTKAVKYSVLYMKAVKALQEAIERIETLEAKVAQLEANRP